MLSFLKKWSIITQLHCSLVYRSPKLTEASIVSTSTCTFTLVYLTFCQTHAPYWFRFYQKQIGNTNWAKTYLFSSKPLWKLCSVTWWKQRTDRSGYINCNNTIKHFNIVWCHGMLYKFNQEYFWRIKGKKVFTNSSEGKTQLTTNLNIVLI